MYQRSQIELAISNLLEPKVRQPSSALRTRIKRLLETDRALGRKPGSNDPEEGHYAFFREAAPGSGFEVQFSSYEGFALLLALQLMVHSWPQLFVVRVLRRVRRDLEKEYDRILKIDPAILFDEKAIARNRQPGSLAYDTTKPAFLVIVSQYGLTRDEEKKPFACSVHCDIGSASSWVAQTIKGVGGGSSMFELTIAAHALAQELQRTKPRGRGRAG
jgi:hypothetical protein